MKTVDPTLPKWPCYCQLVVLFKMIIGIETFQELNFVQYWQDRREILGQVMTLCADTIKVSCSLAKGKCGFGVRTSKRVWQSGRNTNHFGRSSLPFTKHKKVSWGEVLMERTAWSVDLKASGGIRNNPEESKQITCFSYRVCCVRVTG